MEARCEYSQLTIPNDPSYAAVSAKYVAEIAKKIGFTDNDVGEIEQSVRDAVTHVIEYSFEPEERSDVQVSCERVPEGLKITIHDKGLPFDESFSAAQVCENEGPVRQCWESEFFKVTQRMDSISMHNLGFEGKETVLIKHLNRKGINEYFEACDLSPYENLPAERKRDVARQAFTVRQMKSSEAVEVAKCVYKAYGYTYGNENIYYPERLIELNDTGRMHSAVALTNSGEIAGHGALSFHSGGGAIAELGQGVVKPVYRKQGVFRMLTQYLVDKAKFLGLMGVYGQAVTEHVYSQKMSYHFGLEDVAIILGFLPTTTKFRSISERLSQRGSMVIHFGYLKKPSDLEIYPPPHHDAMIRLLYNKIGIAPENIKDPHRALKSPEGQSAIRTQLVPSLNYARIEVEQFGSDTTNEVLHRLRELRLQRVDVINLYLNLFDPNTAHISVVFEEAGFIFAGILPGFWADGDALILQCLNNVPINYDTIKLASPVAKELLAYIQSNDPNVR